MPNPKEFASEALQNSEAMAPQATDMYLELPRAYKKEYAADFKTLPLALRQYLHERESEIERGFSRMNNEVNAKRWIDDIFGSRAERLSGYGIKKAQQWIETMAQIDDALDSDPSGAINCLCQSYGVPFSSAPQSGSSAEQEELKAQICTLQSQIAELCQQLQNSHQEAQKLEEAKRAKDAAFAPKGKNYKRDLSELSTREVLELKMAEYD